VELPYRADEVSMLVVYLPIWRRSRPSSRQKSSTRIVGEIRDGGVLGRVLDPRRI
jgi:hypothetical protein